MISSKEKASQLENPEQESSILKKDLKESDDGQMNTAFDTCDVSANQTDSESNNLVDQMAETAVTDKQTKHFDFFTPEQQTAKIEFSKKSQRRSKDNKENEQSGDDSALLDENQYSVPTV